MPISAWSLTLGGMRVQSALGQPLQAQLSLGELTADELSSIKVGFAPVAVYQSAGIVLNPVLNKVQFSVDASVPNNVVVNLTSTDPMVDTFLDVVLEIQWASGRVVRDYTLLFNTATQMPAPTAVATQAVTPVAPAVTDPTVPLPLPSAVNAASATAAGTVVEATLTPPASEVLAAAATAALPTQTTTPMVAAEPLPQVTAPEAPAQAASGPTTAGAPTLPTPQTATGAASPLTPEPTAQTLAEPTQPAATQAAVEPALQRPEAAPTPKAETKAAEAILLRVRRGDTASELAEDHMPPGVSLDQMLQAMLRANPSAFVDGNVNRLKTGATLQLPTADQARAIDAGQARRLMIAQSKDFNAYRRNLAANAPMQAANPANQVATGLVETQVKDNAEAAPAADQLKLSKGSVATGSEAEVSIAAAKKAQDEQAQQADLTRNIDELKALSQTTPSANGEGTANVDAAAGPTVTPPPETTPSTETPTSAQTTPIERLMAQPWALPSAFALIAVLIALVITRLNRRQKPLSPKEPDTHASESMPDPAANDQPSGDTHTNNLSFNLSDINLDLNPSADTQAADAANSEALFTKFELAKEFLSLGDRVAAKALAEEVLAESTGLLKRRAELFLAELG